MSVRLFVSVCVTVCVCFSFYMSVCLSVFVSLVPATLKVASLLSSPRVNSTSASENCCLALFSSVFIHAAARCYLFLYFLNFFFPDTSLSLSLCLRCYFISSAEIVFRTSSLSVWFHYLYSCIFFFTVLCVLASSVIGHKCEIQSKIKFIYRSVRILYT